MTKVVTVTAMAAATWFVLVYFAVSGVMDTADDDG